jgi:cholinesterase
MDMSIITTVLNYRTMGIWFLESKEVLAANIESLGLFDQRLASRWVFENIKGFGCDPTKVTIRGASVGGSSTRYHLVAFNGNSDGLFSGNNGEC